MSLYGLKEGDFKAMKEILSRHFKNHEEFKVWIYGSRARGDHKPHSDIDLLLRVKPLLTEPQMAGLRADFEESDIPFKVDAVTEEALFGPYRPGVERDRKLILEKL